MFAFKQCPFVSWSTDHTPHGCSHTFAPNQPGPFGSGRNLHSGKERNKHPSKKLRAGRDTISKAAIVGVKDRETNKVSAQVVRNTDKASLQGFIKDNVDSTANVNTDEHAGYQGMPQVHKAVKHSIKEYVRGQTHTNCIESFWSILKRGYHGTYHQWSWKHLNRYVTEFAGRHNYRPANTIDQMASIAQDLKGKRLKYQDLVA